MTTGIYTITSPDGDLYVGSSKSIEKRWIQHKTQLKNGRHHNHRLQEAAQKCGVNALKLEIVQACAESDLLANEQKMVDDLRPNCNLYDIVGTRTDPSVGYHKMAFRCPPRLYSSITEGASEARMSINSFIVKLLREEMDDIDAGRGMKANLSEHGINQIVELFNELLRERGIDP